MNKPTVEEIARDVFIKHLSVKEIADKYSKTYNQVYPLYAQAWKKYFSKEDVVVTERNFTSELPKYSMQDMMRDIACMFSEGFISTIQFNRYQQQQSKPTTR